MRGAERDTEKYRERKRERERVDGQKISISYVQKKRRASSTFLSYFEHVFVE